MTNELVERARDFAQSLEPSGAATVRTRRTISMITDLADALEALTQTGEAGEIVSYEDPERPEWLSDLKNVVDDIEDEADRVYFGSTNDADTLREVVSALEQASFPMRYFRRLDHHRHIAQLREDNSALQAQLAAREAERDEAVEHIRVVKRVLTEGQLGITCTIWHPDYPAETMLDFLDAFLTRMKGTDNG